MSQNKNISSTIKVLGKSLTGTQIRLFLFLFSFLLYANTLTHEYAVDDAIVIYDNMYVKDGVKGIPGLLQKDTFFGFFKKEGKAKLVSGGRYRPLTPIMFAFEWQLFGNNPFIGHLINVLLFGLLVIILFDLLHVLISFKYDPDKGLLIAFLAAILFAAHPIHTECVANIKGRDEIMALLLSILAFKYTIKWVDSTKIKYGLTAMLIFFFALMAKENSITYLAVVPLGLFLFRDLGTFTSISKVGLLFLATLAFLGVRTAVLGMDFGGAPMELMNNPFIKIDNNNYVPFSGSEKMATICYTLGKYVSLLFFPHPLTHDYYPRHIDEMSWADFEVLLSILMHILMLAAAFIYLKKHRILSFGILYYFITLSIVSNIVFPVGTNMGERFLFMPSLGFCLIIASGLVGISKEKWGIILCAVIAILFSIKTITRNPVWKNDFTLFTTDVKVSKRSAKLLNAAGGALSTSAYEMKEGPERTKRLEQANEYLINAIKIHPNYKNAYLLLGNSNYYLNNFEEAIRAYENALSVSPNYDEAMNNMAICLRDAGRHYGEQKGDLQTALKYLNRSYSIKSNDEETVRLLGVAFGVSGDSGKAIKYFRELTQLNPKNARAFVDLGTAYRNSGDETNANINFNKALELDPNALNHLNK